MFGRATITLGIGPHSSNVFGRYIKLSAFLAKVVHSKRSGMDYTVLPANNTTPALDEIR